MVVSDLDDMFVPMASGFLVDPVQAKSQINTLLDMLPGMMEVQPDGNRCAVGAAVKGALIGLVSRLSCTAEMRLVIMLALNRWSDQPLSIWSTYCRSGQAYRA